MAAKEVSSPIHKWTPIGEPSKKPAYAAGRVWGTARSRIKGLFKAQSFRFFRAHSENPSLKKNHTLIVLTSRGRPLDNASLNTTLQHIATKPDNKLIPVHSLYVAGPISFSDARTELNKALEHLKIPEGETRYVAIPISTPPLPEKVVQYKKTALIISTILFPITIALGTLFVVNLGIEAFLRKLPILSKWQMRTLKFARWIKNPFIGHITTGLIEVQNIDGKYRIKSIEHFDLKGLHPKETTLADSHETVEDLWNAVIEDLSTNNFDTSNTKRVYHQTGLQSSYDVQSSPNVHQCGWGVALYAKLRSEGNSPEEATTQLQRMDLEQARLDLAHEYAKAQPIPPSSAAQIPTYLDDAADEF